MSNRFVRSLGRFINRILNPLGLQLTRYPIKTSSIVSFESMLTRLAKRSIEINTIVDVGASDGRWSRRIESAFPNAKYLLIEANEVHKAGLENHVREHPNAEFVLAAAGDSPGHIYFDDSDPLGGVASHEPVGKTVKSFPCTTIDSEIQKLGWKGPFLVKLDTHGFEVPILNGASNVLEQVDLMIIEAYNFNLTGDTLRFWELCNYLERLGFRPIDMFDPMFRPKDDVFWQLDLVFARSNRSEFLSNSYQ